MTVDLCLWLGTEEDRTLRHAEVVEAHRCYARKPPWAMDVAHQAWYCLTDQHRACKYYRESARIPAPPAPRPIVTVEDEFGPAPGELPWPRVVIWVASLLLVAALIYIIGARVLNGPPAATLASSVLGASPSPSPVPTLNPTATPLPTASPSPTFALPEPVGTPTPYPGGAIYGVSPEAGAVGWVASDEGRGKHLGDSFLYAGVFDGVIYHGVFYLDLSPVPRGAKIYGGMLELTGLEDRRLGMTGAWEVRVLAEEVEADWSRQTYQDVHNATIQWTLSPALSADELLVGYTNTFVLPKGLIRDLEQRLLDERYLLSLRIDGPLAGENSLYAWDSGYGPASRRNWPRLVLNVGAAPRTPPPTVTPKPTITPEGFVATGTHPATDAIPDTATPTP